MLTEKQLSRLEKTQETSLKKATGVFSSTSTNAIEVLANIVPFRLRILELCSKEWLRTKSLPNNHRLKRMLMEGSTYDGKKETPLGYLNFISKDIQNKLPRISLCTHIMSDQIEPSEKSIFYGKLGNSKNRTPDQVS